MAALARPASAFSPRSLLALTGFLALSLVVSLIGGSATASSVGDWYAGLAKPAFQPPNWVFGPVWTILYVMMAVAAWRIWRLRPQPGTGRALGLYGAQLALNLAWSLLFFGLRQPGWAAIDIVALLVLVAGTALAFGRLDRWAGALMIPYVAWVAFATALNLAIWRLN